ncbi:MAG TPA: O-antigen ligase family protein [Gaiellaceae bacterium]|nr:O-antigen ligase family protein [Gaiellaceae bacterium]
MRLAAIAEQLGTAAVAFVGVVALEAANGGYFPNTWAWGTLALASLLVAALVVRRAVAFGFTSLALVGGLVAFAAWSLVSSAWTSSGSPTFEAERVLLYATVAALVVCAARTALVPWLAGGALAAIASVDVYSLATRLYPDRLGSYDATAVYRLSTPIGYWNGLGIVSAIGIVLALGVALRGKTVIARAAAALPLPVLALTLYFAYSRGAIISLAAVMLILLAVDARRLQLLTAGALVVAPSVPALVAAVHAKGLGTQGAPLATAAHEGRHVAHVLLVCALAGAALSAGIALVEPRIRVHRAVRLAYGGLIGGAAVVAVVVALVLAGGPVHVVSRAWDHFKAPPVGVSAGTNEVKRLYSLSSNGRLDLWRSAWRDAQAHPWLGSGAGTFDQWWLQHRPYSAHVKDAHNLYLQTLAEVGPFGLLFLVLGLGAPLVAGLRARRNPLVPFILAAYCAYLIHAAAEWTWQLAGVTVPAIVLGATLVVAARDEARPVGDGLVRRVAPVAVAAAVGVLAFFMVLGNVPLTKATNAADTNRWADSAREARKAIRWLPWSAEPWRLLGEAELAQGRRAPARAALEKGLAKEPKSWQLWFDLAAASRGREAKAALAQASRLNPKSPEIATFRNP